jgi:hypothetical protein
MMTIGCNIVDTLMRHFHTGKIPRMVKIGAVSSL